jgi:hypothetical protein
VKGTVVAPSANMATAAPLERVDILLHTLRGERYLRRALLEEIAERLALDSSRGPAVAAARALLVGLDRGGIDFETEVRRLERLVAAAPPPSPPTE